MDNDAEIRWQLLAGRSATEDGNLLLSSAVPIIHVCAAFFYLVCGILFEGFSNIMNVALLLARYFINDIY
jgi:hypothetical protein